MLGVRVHTPVLWTADISRYLDLRTEQLHATSPPALGVLFFSIFRGKDEAVWRGRDLPSSTFQLDSLVLIILYYSTIKSVILHTGIFIPSCITAAFNF